MKRLDRVLTEQRDTQGRLVVNAKAKPCPFCGAPPRTVTSECGRVVWTHPPVNCCRKKALHHNQLPPVPKPYKD